MALLVQLVGPIEALGHEECSGTDAAGNFVGQMDLAWCEDRNFKEADAELNRLYKEVYRRMAGEADRLHQLVEAERKWIAARDADCKRMAVDEDVIGSTRDYVIIKCTVEKTAERIAKLKAMP